MFSDNSDCESEIIGSTKGSKSVKKTSKRVFSDSEGESPLPPPPARKKRTQANTPSRSVKKSKKLGKPDIFGLSEEGEPSPLKKEELKCSLSSKVADGVQYQRPAATLTGQYYVEVRVYHAEEAQRARPDERYKKALVTAKVRLDTDAEPWADLTKFMRGIKPLFDKPTLIK